MLREGRSPSEGQVIVTALHQIQKLIADGALFVVNHPVLPDEPTRAALPCMTGGGS